jgi:hypothetical protein
LAMIDKSKQLLELWLENQTCRNKFHLKPTGSIELGYATLQYL